MEFLASTGFSDVQNVLLTCRINGGTYNDIRDRVHATFHRIIPDSVIVTALTRSALGYRWELDMSGGALPFLCEEDMNSLKETVRESAEMGASMDSIDVIDEAVRLKTERVIKAFNFLRVTNSPVLQSHVAAMSVDPPTRQWINNILDDMEAHIKDRRMIDPKRLESCSYEVITTHFVRFANAIREIEPMLLFGADETMMDATPRGKVVVPDDVKQVLEEGLPNMPHISGMMCHNVVGNKLPPFIILSELKKLPSELEELVASGQIWVGSTKNGYMTKEMFLIWVFHFINWLSDFRSKMPNCHLRDANAMLIMDGHNSRENPLALTLLRRFRVSVLILPSHTTHVLQMFDVGLASPLKKEFTEKFRKELRKLKDSKKDLKVAALLRLASIKAFVSAWNAVCTPINCEAAAQKTGTYPVDFNAAKSSPFVRNLTPEEQARYEARQKRNENRVQISGRIITEPECIVELMNGLKNTPKNERLCNVSYYMRKVYSEVVAEFISDETLGVRLLSHMPPFVKPNIVPNTA